jgi:hypothetical protein
VRVRVVLLALQALLVRRQPVELEQAVEQPLARAWRQPREPEL